MGHRRSPHLNFELAALEHALFDGAKGEGIHKDFHRVILTSTGSEFQFQSATLRLAQNLTEYDLMCSMGMAAKWMRHWTMYKSVLQKVHSLRTKVLGTELGSAQVGSAWRGPAADRD